MSLIRRLRLALPLTATFLTIVTFGRAAVAQQESGTRIRFDAAEITLAGRVQMQLNTSSVDEAAPTEMLLRRVRFGANIRVNDFVGGRIHPELSGTTLGLADAYMQLSFSPGLRLLAGRAHRPFGTMEETSSTLILPIERGVRIRGLAAQELSSLLSGLRYSDRDVGLQLRGAPTGAPLGFSYAAGVFAGPLQGAVGEEWTQQYVARLGVTPLERTRIGFAWSRRDFARDEPEGGFDLSAGDAFLADVEFGGPTPAPGLHLVGQIATGDLDPFRSHDFTGGQLWAGYRFQRGERVAVIEPLLRVSHARLDRLADQTAVGGTLITPGLNLYFGGLNRLMLNYDIWRGEAEVNESSFKAQFQMVF